MEGTKDVEDHHALLPNKPFVPPKGDICYINTLPPELLSRIFEAGIGDDDHSEDEEGMTDYLNSLSSSKKDADSVDSGNADVEMTKEPADDEDGKTEDDKDERDSDGEECSDLFSWPPFQIIASHVCHHWRNVALSTPSLWTTIVVGPDDRQPYAHTAALLERSKSLPIDIYIDCEPEDPDAFYDDETLAPSEADVEFLCSMLIPNLHRSRTIEVSVSEYPHMYIFLTAASDPSISAAPQLETLELYHHEDRDVYDSFAGGPMSKQSVIFGGSAPCLTRVILWGVHVDWDQQWIASAPNLTELELAYHEDDVRPTWIQFSSILRCASSLEKLSLRQSGPSGQPSKWFVEPTIGAPSDLNAPIQLLKLKSFILAFQPQSDAIALLRKFCMPSLKHLVLDFDKEDYTEFVRVLAGPATLLFPSSNQEEPRSLLKNLESLKIGGLPCETECVDILYAGLENLTQLNLSLSYLPHVFVDIICVHYKPLSGGPMTLCLPRLQTLYVSGTSSAALRQIANRRKETGYPLDALYMEESCHLVKEDVAWLKENVKTFGLFEGSDDEDVDDEDDHDEDFDDFDDEVDEWSEVSD